MGQFAITVEDCKRQTHIPCLIHAQLRKTDNERKGNAARVKITEIGHHNINRPCSGEFYFFVDEKVPLAINQIEAHRCRILYYTTENCIFFIEKNIFK